MNGIFSREIYVYLVRYERSYRRDESCYAHQHLISGGVYALLIFCKFFRIESSSGAADIPVGKVFVDKVVDGSDGLHVIVLIHVFCNVAYQLVVFAQNPSVQLRPLAVRDI